MYWQPLNLSLTCQPHSQLNACSNFGYIYLNLLVHLYSDSKDRRIQESLHHEALKHPYVIEHGTVISAVNRYEKENEEEYDFIVVGAGAAGCVVANRLTEVQQWKTLLLEAGPEQPDATVPPALSTALLGSNIDWKYETMADDKSCLARPGRRCPWPRGKVMGGSSSINSMAYIRGNKLDYDTWAKLGNVGWSYEDVLPYFKKSEKNLNIEGLDRKYHGVDGEQTISRYPYVDDPSIMLTEAFKEKGLPLTDFNGPQQFGTMQGQNFAKNGERVSTNQAFIQPIRYKRKNLTVKVNSEVVKILINDKNVAYGVKYIHDGKIRKAFAKKDIIVSAGAINSPKLLMLSGIGPRKHLEDLHIKVYVDSAVGENLHDHVTYDGALIILPNKTSTRVSNKQILDEVKAYRNQDIKSGPLSGNGPVSSIAFYKTDPNLPAPDIQVQVDNTNWREYVKDPIGAMKLPIFPTAFYDALLPRPMNLVPKSRGLLLLNSTDPNGPPLMYPNYFGEIEDLTTVIKGLRMLLSLEDSEAFKRRGAYFSRIPLPACKKLKWGTDEYFECLLRSYTSTPYHPVGTCKMGPETDEKAVVDPRLRVYGISGLRVIDASIMPIVPRGNTNAPSILVGERGVALVKEDWLVNYYKDH